MKNKIIIDGKEFKNITITDKNDEVLVVLLGNGQVVQDLDYKVKFDVGEDELINDKEEK